MSHLHADSSELLADFVWTIVVAGGAGLRFGSRKQFADLSGKSVLQWSIDAADSVSAGIVVVVPADSADSQNISAGADLRVVAGGTTRAGSVRAGLAAIPDDARIVLVHDAARPLASPALFASVVLAVSTGGAAVIPVVEVSDTIRHIDGGVVDRSELRAVQTPQGFDAAQLRAAHADAGEATDDATLVEALGHRVVTVEGEPENRKLTEPTDLVTAAALIDHRKAESS